jgi:hypothetical protein
MSNEEFLYHSGICPNCPTDTPQRFLFAANESSGRIFEAGKAFLEGKVETFSMFRCDGCGAILVFKTFLEDVVDVDNPILFNPEWILDLDSDEFKTSSTPIYSTLKKQLLHPSVPEHVRRCYETAIRVKPISNDLYALQLRKTLEALCKDKGAKGAKLVDQIDELWPQIHDPAKQKAVRNLISTAAHELREIGNFGAHDSELATTDAHAHKLRHLLELITECVYDR